MSKATDNAAATAGTLLTTVRLVLHLLLAATLAYLLYPVLNLVAIVALSGIVAAGRWLSAQEAELRSTAESQFSKQESLKITFFCTV